MTFLERSYVNAAFYFLFFSISITLFTFNSIFDHVHLFCVSLEDAYNCHKVTMKMRTEFI